MSAHIFIKKTIVLHISYGEYLWTSYSDYSATTGVFGRMTKDKNNSGKILTQC